MGELGFVAGCGAMAPEAARPGASWAASRTHRHTARIPPATAPRRAASRVLATAAAAAPVLLPEADAAFAQAMKTMASDAGKKKITLLGSTGSIGTQTLDIVQGAPDFFEISALAAGSNIDLLVDQALQFKPGMVCIQNDSLYAQLKDRLAASLPHCKVVSGDQGLVECAAYADSDVVVTGIVGCAGLLPTVAAIKAGKDIALANKETLIAGGPVVLPLLDEYGVRMTPADSEHSAIFQCLQGAPVDSLSKVILTASGGAFRDWDTKDLTKVTVADALNHPNWSMGAKITIDSATLMNKGLEVIEAHYLFGADYDDIDIVVHPQSIIHSMVEFSDTSVLAQLGWPDMRLPLLYSMSWPRRLKMPYSRLDLVKQGSLTFRAPDNEKYPCMDLAYAAGRQAGSMTAVLNAANEAAVELFRQEKIHYLDIPRVIESVMEDHKRDWIERPSLEEIVHFDTLSRTRATDLIAASKIKLFS